MNRVKIITMSDKYTTRGGASPSLKPVLSKRSLALPAASSKSKKKPVPSHVARHLASAKSKKKSLPTKKHTTVDDFPSSTSLFRKVDADTLNVEYKDASLLDFIEELSIENNELIVPEEVYVKHWNASKIRNVVDEQYKDEWNELIDKEKTFAQLIHYILENETVVRGTEESRTNSFVIRLLDKLQFSEYPFMLQLQHLVMFSIYTKEISSKPDFCIIKNKLVALIDGDKHIRNVGPPAWGEYQFAGELIASAYSNYQINSNKYNSTLYGVRVIGLKFTFYKANITSDYLDSLGNGLPDLSVTIERCPQKSNNKDFPSLDYGNADDRRQIIDILVRIRKNIKK